MTATSIALHSMAAALSLLHRCRLTTASGSADPERSLTNLQQLHSPGKGRGREGYSNLRHPAKILELRAAASEGLPTHADE